MELYIYNSIYSKSMTFYGVIVIGSNASELEKEEFTCVHGTQTHKLPSLKERF